MGMVEQRAESLDIFASLVSESVDYSSEMSESGCLHPSQRHWHRLSLGHDAEPILLRKVLRSG